VRRHGEAAGTEPIGGVARVGGKGERAAQVRIWGTDIVTQASARVAFCISVPCCHVLPLARLAVVP
jgi:hypothetical protein